MITDIQERIARLQRQPSFSGAPNGWEKRFIIYPGEIPWWSVEDLEERKKVYMRQSMRVRNKKRPSAAPKAYKRWDKGHPGVHTERVRKWYEDHPGAAAKESAKRRERSTDPEAYAARVELLHTIHESCAMCGALYLISHQIDHILALCLDGTDDWDNLQPACILCHREKTKEDMRKFKKLVAQALRQAPIT